MAAEFHLAEDALALHLLLQHLEGLVDIVVTDENLHAAYLLVERSMGRMPRRPIMDKGGWRTGYARIRVPIAPPIINSRLYLDYPLMWQAPAQSTIGLGK
jgi:hypothetical protein